MENRITEMQVEETEVQEEETILGMINDYYSRMDG
ncbi:hypothetical protein EDD64_1079 [Effusibacillus lacus]|nr:hypothetical protein EDD64_1079 [Effusibacillus lacus]